MASMGNSNLWQQILRASSVRSELPVANVLVVGDPESGKAALMARLAAQRGSGDVALPATTDALLACTTLDVLDPRASDSSGDASGALAWLRYDRSDDVYGAHCVLRACGNE